MPRTARSLDDPEVIRRFVSQAKSKIKPTPAHDTSEINIDAFNENVKTTINNAKQTSSVAEQSSNDHWEDQMSNVTADNFSNVQAQPRDLSPKKLRLKLPKEMAETPPQAHEEGQAATSSSLYSPRAVSDAFHKFVQSMDGVPLSKSIWATDQTLKLQKPQQSEDIVNSNKPSAVKTTSKVGVADVATQTKPLSRLALQALATEASKQLDKEEAETHAEHSPKPTQDDTFRGLSVTPTEALTVDLETIPEATLKEKRAPVGEGTMKTVPPHLRTKSANVLQRNFSGADSNPPMKGKSPTVNLKPVGDLADRSQVLEEVPKSHISTTTAAAPRPAEGRPITIPQIDAQTEKEEGETSPGIPVSTDLSATTPVVPTPHNMSLEQKPEAKPTATPGPAVAHVEEDRTEQIKFKSWGTPTRRDGPASERRTVVITKLPPTATHSFVASLIHGGNLERIHLTRGDTTTTATVRFLDGAECQKFYDDCDNGLVYGKNVNGTDKVAWVDLKTDVDVIGGRLREQIGRGCTRCVRIVPVDEDFTFRALESLAARAKRIVESVEDGRSPNKSRVVVFRFAEIEHAIHFHEARRTHPDWEHCNITYVDDPGKNATGPRLLK